MLKSGLLPGAASKHNIASSNHSKASSAKAKSIFDSDSVATTVSLGVGRVTGSLEPVLWLIVRMVFDCTSKPDCSVNLERSNSDVEWLCCVAGKLE